MAKRERIIEHDHSDRYNGGALAGQALNPGSTASTTIVTSGGAAVLDDLGDVNVSSTPPVDNDVLTYDSALGLWVPEAVSSGATLDSLSDVTITTPATGDRLRYDGSGWVNSTAMWVPVMVEDGATGLWYVTVTGDGDAVMTEVP